VTGVAQYTISFLLTSAVMSAIILAILVFNMLFTKVFSARLRYAVWLVVLIGLIIPLRPVIGNGLFGVSLPAAAQTQTDDTENLPFSDTLPGTDSTQEINVTERTVTDSNVISPIMIILLIWGIVAFFVFAYHIWHYLRFAKMVWRWGVQTDDEKVLSLLQTVMAETGLSGKKIDLRICGFVSSSMLTGFSRPVILLPEKHFDEDELELIFKHELIHYKRHDLFIKLLSVIAVSVQWFNPFVYWMCAAMQTDGEASCDEAVLQNSDKENRQLYAEVIIGMIGNKPKTMLSACFYGGKSRIKKRLDCIMDTTRKIQKPAVIVLLAVAVLTLLSGSVFVLAQTSSNTSVPIESEAKVPAEISMEQEENITLSTETTPPLASFSPDTTEITAESAKEIALTKTGGGTVIECKLDYENGREVYEIKIINKNTEYEMDIDVITGAVTDYSAEAIESSDDRDEDHDSDDD